MVVGDTTKKVFCTLFQTKKKNWTEYNLIYFLCICVITELWYVKMLMRCDSVVCCGQKATLLCMGPDFRDQMILFAIPAVKVCRIACSIILHYIDTHTHTHTHTNKWFNANLICTISRERNCTMYDFHNFTDTLKFWTEKWDINKTFLVFIRFWWNLVKL